ncbi:hypothetical protein Tco_1131379, partial [Tanacetum coccineum]
MVDDEGNESSDAYCSSDDEDLGDVDFHTEVDDNVVIKIVTTNDPFLNKIGIKYCGRDVQTGKNKRLKVNKVTTRSRSKTDEGT